MGIVTGIKDLRIRYLRHEHNMGLSVSRNTAIKVARGRYINFLDDDDEIHHLKIEKQLKVFAQKDKGVGVVYCGWQYVYNGKVTSVHSPFYSGNVFKRFLSGCFTAASTPLIRSDCFEKVGLFDEKLKSCEDWDMWIRIAKYFSFEFIPEILAACHTHVQQMSSRLQDRITARERIINKYQTDLVNAVYAYSAQLGRLGILHCLNNSKDKGLRHIFNAIGKDPAAWKNYAYLLLLTLDGLKKGALEHFVTEKRGNETVFY